MTEKLAPSLSQVAEKHRRVLWILLLLLTSALLRFPVRFEFEYRPVQSPDIFGDNLSLFAALYSIWMLLLLVLIFSRRETKWEKLALVCVFAVVFLGFWAIITPYFRHPDEWYRAAHIQYLLEYGRADPLHPNLEYFGFPGLQYLGAAFVQVTGLSIFVTRTILVLLLAVLLASLVFALFLKAIKEPAMAAVGVLLVLLGNILISKGSLLFSSQLAYIFLVSFLLLLNRHEQTPGRWQNNLLLAVLILATTVTHLMTSVALIFVLAGIYLVRRAGRREASSSAYVLVLSAVIVLAWEIYWASRTFNSLIAPIPELLGGGFTLSGLFLGAGVTLGTTGAGIPLWALTTKVYWWASIYGIGSVLWLRSALTLGKLSLIEKEWVGGLLGIIMLTVLATFAGAQGYQGAIRYLMYAPFFTVPFLLLFIVNLGGFKRNVSVVSLAVLLFVFSLPTLFVNNDMIAVDAVYPSDVSSREHMRQNLDEKDLTVMSTFFALPLNQYYLPEAAFKTDPSYFYLENPAQLWTQLHALVDMATIRGEWAKHEVREQAVFVYSRRLTGSYEHMLGIRPADPEWQRLEDRLISAGNRIYDSGAVQLYLFSIP